MTIETIEKPYNYKGHKINLQVSPEMLFTPNAVTKLFSKAVQINPGDTVFDIGSGTGPLTVFAALEPSNFVYSVEIVKEQFELAKQNIKNHGLSHKTKLYHGSLIDPIPLEIKANVIIGDVSGIAKNIAEVMVSNKIPWYPPSIPTGGIDGTEVTTSLIKQASSRLQENGRFYFPVASLSAYDKIEKTAKSHFTNLEVKVEANFPLEPGQKELIEKVGIPGTYEFFNKGSKYVWRGWIYEATKPN